MEFFANLTFGLVLFIASLGVASVLLIGQLTDARNNAHPFGFRGRIMDEALTAGPVWTILLVNISGQAFRSLYDFPWWFPLQLGLLGLVLLSFFLPPVRRAKERLALLKGLPA